MPARIRLQRHGKKGKPFYQIVVADGRAPRDGRFIENIGKYNPMTNPAEINLDFDRAMYWIGVGASPSDTVRSILRREGVLYKHHLIGGVNKGAFTMEVAEQKFAKWVSEKEANLSKFEKEMELQAKNEKKKALEAEVKVNETREALLAEKRQKELDAQAKQNNKEEVVEAKAPVAEVEETAPEAVAETEQAPE